MMQRKHFRPHWPARRWPGRQGPAAMAQEKPLEWVIGYATGGGSDVVAHVIAAARPWAAIWSAPSSSTTRPAPGTNIAAEYSAIT